MEPSALPVVSEAAKGIAQKLFAKPAEEMGELLGDMVRTLRWKNEQKILIKVGDYARKHNLKVKPLELKALVPLLEGASLEEDPTLQELWSRLIANASATSAPVSVTVFAAEFLRGISQNEARIVEGIVSTLDRAHEKRQQENAAIGDVFPLYPRKNVEFPPHRFITKKRLDRVGLEEKPFEIALDNLVRYNVVAKETLYDMDGRPDTDGYTFTRLGWEVVQLVRASEPATA